MFLETQRNILCQPCLCFGPSVVYIIYFAFFKGLKSLCVEANLNMH
jgi:hypothetical protein